jgi:hypothetical protein
VVASGERTDHIVGLKEVRSMPSFLKYLALIVLVGVLIGMCSQRA